MTRQVVAFGDIDFTAGIFGLTTDSGVPLTDDDGARLYSDDARSLTIDGERAFDRLIAGSYQIAARVDVVFGGVTIERDLAFTSGTVTMDRTQSILSSLSLNVADPLRVPVAPDDVLTPYGYELQVWRGVSVPGGELMCPLGVFPIQRSTADGVTLLSSVTAEDRSKKVSDAGFEDTYSIAQGTNYVTAIRDLITAAISNTEFLFPSTTFTTPRLTFTSQDDRWEKAQMMARSIGNEILFDGLGRCVMRSEPSFQSEPVATIADGANLLAASMVLDRGPAYNRVIATSSNASVAVPVRGVATDNDPSSPTYYGDDFGRKPRDYASPFIATQAQANSAAAAILASNRGVAKSVDVGLLADPRRETSDVVLVQQGAFGLDELHIIDRATIGLTASDAMSASVRAQQVAA